MAITVKREDKFAFLFTGNISNSVYLKDMENVYYTLTKFYNYNPNNIWLVFGSNPTGLTDFSTNYPGLAASDNVKRYLGTTDPVQDFLDTFEKDNIGLFNHILNSGHPDPGEKKSVLLYFTGEGSLGNLNINETSDQIDVLWLQSRLGYELGPPVFASLKDWCNINVVMQQAFGGGFHTIINALTIASFTSACSSSDASPDFGTIEGSHFTYGLCKALQFEQIWDKDDNTIYADELFVEGNLLISLSNAGARFIAPDPPNSIDGQTGFAVGYCRKNDLPITSNPPNTIVKTSDETDYCLGKPDFLIRDGNHPGVGLSLDASPDIFITHPIWDGAGNPDLPDNQYIQDADDGGVFENKIQVKVLNIGTHPVRKYSVGVIRYDTSTAAGTGEKRVKETDLSGEVLCPIPIPNDDTEPEDTPTLLFSKISEFSDIPFPTQFHESIRAKAGLETITDADLDTWDYENDYSQAQLNISYSEETDVIVITPGTGKSGYKPEEKFAFLFAGNTGDQYENDIIKVYDTLTNYYGYPKDHIWVVSGGTNFTATFTGSNVSSVSNETELTNVLQPFKNAAGTVNGNLPDILNNAFLYFTGEGSREDIAGTDTSLLVINGAGGTEKISGAWLKTQLETDTDFLNNCQVDIFCEQSYGEGFYNDNSALISFNCGNKSFTSSCTISETSNGGTSGSNFTDAWIKGLNMMALTSGTNSGKYADELTADTEPTDNILVSLKKAWVYAKEVAANTGFYNELGEEVKYLGLPNFLIRDGNHESLTEPVYESPDIFLTHPNNAAMDADPLYVDLYVEDDGGAIDNVINVRVLNIGTHPVRKYYVGVTRYDSGASGTGEDRVEETQLSGEVLCPIPIPNDDTQPADSTSTPMLFSKITKFNDIRFPETTHKCVRAKVQLEAFSATDLETWTWNYSARYSEAQRNIDYSGVSDASGGGKSLKAGEGVMPEKKEEIPIDAEDEKNEEIKNNLRGFKEHIYEIRNPYKEKRKFVIVFPKSYLRYQKELFNFEWFELNKHKENELIPLKISRKSNFRIKFELKPKESKNILLYFAVKPKIKIEKLVSLPFEILAYVNRRKICDILNFRRFFFKRFRRKYVNMGGITLKIRQEKAPKLFGTVFDKNKKPIRNAMIKIQTVNKRQGAIIRTDKNGNYEFENINPDVYRVTAVNEKWHSKEHLINLFAAKRREEGIRLDFIEND